MKNTHLAGALVACLAAAALFPGASQAASVPLLFNDPTGTYDDGTYVGGTWGCNTLADCYNIDHDPGTGTLFGWKFKNVATDMGTTLDAIVTYSVLNDGDISFMEGTSRPNTSSPTGVTPYGVYPGYTTSTTDQPNDDFGFLYNAITTEGSTGGVEFTFSFYETGTLTPYTIPELSIAAYDVDGSSNQDEYVTAYTADGLVSYQLDVDNPMYVNCVDPNSATPIADCTAPGDGFRFDGPDANRSEDDPAGGVILNYVNTSSVTLSFGSNTGSVPDGVFSAVDGDLSLFAICDEDITDNCFDDPVATVPEPSAVWLLGLGMLGLGILHRRRKAA